MYKNLSIKNKLTIMFVVVILIMASIQTYMTGRQLMQETYRSVNQFSAAITKSNVLGVEKWIDGKIQILQATEQAFNYSAEPVSYFLQSQHSGKFSTTYAGLSTGEFFVSDPNNAPPEGYDPRVRDWYKEAKTSTKPVVTNPYLDMGTGQLVVSIADAFNTGGYEGVIGADISIQTIVDDILIIILIALSISLSLMIVRRISNQANVIKEITDTNNISLRAQNMGNDEISQIGLSFNQLLDKIHSLLGDTQQKSVHLAGSASSMRTQLEGVLRDFDQQSQHTMMMATAVNEMSLTVAEIANNTEAAASNATQSHQHATEGQETLHAASQEITQLSSTLILSQTDISHLSGLVGQVGSVVEMIQSIAEQTNLLALNAAIEAARAGGQGRGFAVVADEVRSLATRTQSSTEEIRAIIESIQTQTDKVVTNIEKCSEQGESSVEKARSAEAILNKIIIDMSTISDSSIQIASAIEEQNTTTNEVSQTITELNDLTDSNIHSAQACLTELQQVAEQAEEMKEQVSQFKTS